MRTAQSACATYSSTPNASVPPSRHQNCASTLSLAFFPWKWPAPAPNSFLVDHFSTAAHTIVRSTPETEAPDQTRILLPKPLPTMTSMTASTQTACEAPAAWSFESATTAQRALNPIIEETAPSTPKLSRQFPIEQVLTRTVILEQRSPKKKSPKRTVKKDLSKSTNQVTAPPTPATKHATSEQTKPSKPVSCPAEGCKHQKKVRTRLEDDIPVDEGPINYVKKDLQEERAQFDRCAGIDNKPRTRDFKRTIFSKIAEESFKVRRVQRKKAKPKPFKGKPKTTKAAQLRFKFIRNQAVSSSLTEAHMKKYRKPPFQNVGVIRLCYEKLTEKLEKLKVRRGRSKSPAKKKTRTKRK